MSIQSEIDRISNNVNNAIQAVEAKGVSVPEGANSDNLPELISEIFVGYEDAVRYSAQSLTDAQKSQARENIGAVSETELSNEVTSQLTTAKESGEFDGKDGYSIYSSTESHPKAGSNIISDLDLSMINTHGRTMQVGDIVILSQRYLYELTDFAGVGTAEGVLVGDIKGADGAKGTSVTVSQVTESTTSGGSNVVTFSDGKTLTVKNGKDGYTPIKGTDYFTEADKTEMVNSVIAQLPKYTGEVI